MVVARISDLHVESDRLLAELRNFANRRLKGTYMEVRLVRVLNPVERQLPIPYVKL